MTVTIEVTDVNEPPDAVADIDTATDYIEEGLFFDNHFEGEDAVAGVFLTTHTESIDSWYSAREGNRTVSTPKPAQPIPPGLERLVHRLERNGRSTGSSPALPCLAATADPDKPCPMGLNA